MEGRLPRGGDIRAETGKICWWKRSVSGKQNRILWFPPRAELWFTHFCMSSTVHCACKHVYVCVLWWLVHGDTQTLEKHICCFDKHISFDSLHIKLQGR